MNTIDKRVLITELRKQGKTFDFIGRQLKMTRQGVHQFLHYQPHPRPIKEYIKKPRREVDKTLRNFAGRDYTREMVRIRDSHKCQECGKSWKVGSRRFDVHHLNGLCGQMSTAYDRISNIDGLITLCHKCHYNRHDFNG